ncbi:hypothetical protein MRX96_008926 [Rhipicephalus microplus]
MVHRQSPAGATAMVLPALARTTMVRLTTIVVQAQVASDDPRHEEETSASAPTRTLAADEGGQYRRRG